MNKHRHNSRRRGVMVVWLALSLAAILAMIALAIDGGRMLTERQHVQATADAAALAAAGVLYKEFPSNAGLDTQGNARTAALQMTAANGITDGNNATVTVNIPPTQGDFVGKPGYAEVMVSNRIAASFSVIFRLSRLTVNARAVARGIKTGQLSGVFAHAPSGSGTFHLHDQTIVHIVNAPVYVNSSGSSAFQVDNGGSITASTYNVTGTASYPAGGVVGTVKTGVPPTPDPLASLQPPSTAGVPVQRTANLNVTGTQTIDPGIYIGGIKVSSTGNLTMNPGVYIIQGGGFAVTGGKVQGTGVMIYNTGPNSLPAGTGAISFDQNSAITLSPPATGAYAGISLFQDRGSNQNVVITPYGDKNITGAIYAKAAQVQMHGASPNTPVDVIGSVVIANTLLFEHGNIKIDNTLNPLPSTNLYGLVD